VVTNAVEAVRRLLAAPTVFELDAEKLAEWEAISRRRARDPPSMRRARPSPFAD
jgi:hypothetical protein